MDEVKNAMKGKIAINLDGMLKKNRFTFHSQCVGVPPASKVSSATAGVL